MLLPNKPFLFLILFPIIWTVVDSATHGPAHAPSPSSVDCSNLILNMADCLNFVAKGSTVTKPQGKCCSGFKTVLQTDAECICQAFKNSAELGVSLNVTKAMELPSACKLSAPSIASCGLSISPSGAPAPASSIAAPPTSPQGTTEQAPAPAPEKAGSSVLTVSVGYVATATAAVLGVASIVF